MRRVVPCGGRVAVIQAIYELAEKQTVDDRRTCLVLDFKYGDVRCEQITWIVDDCLADQYELGQEVWITLLHAWATRGQG
jgi:hypothetical protein